jgi:hypothetical protein
MRVRVWLAALIVVAMSLAGRAARGVEPALLRRVAVVVGANEPPPGRQALRFAHEDARVIADVLTRVGRFAPADVDVMLDPRPGELLAALDDAARKVASAGGEALLFFYYSGHSDGQSLYPHGEALSVVEVRERLARTGARLRVGLLDTCRGGSWTQAKGLSVGPPLDAADLLNVAAEGTALVSSSSGLENAHEAEAIRGSFFTHHFAAGLLGVADRSGDGSVTLEEAFEYAKERTVRDSARLAATPQHPSFDLQLRGRQDIVLTVLSSAPSGIEIEPARAMLEVIHLASGVTIAEAPVALRPLRLAVPPGRYLVRRVDGARHVFSKEIEVHPGETVSVAEGQLEATGDVRLALKGDDDARRPIAESSTPPKGWLIWQLAAGISTTPLAVFGFTDATQGHSYLERSFATEGSLAYGITDRLTWLAPLPLFAYRFGREGDVEIIPSGGLTGLGYSSIDGIVAIAAGGVGLRVWTAPEQSVIANADVAYPFDVQTSSSQISFGGHYLPIDTSLGYTWTIRDVVTLHFAGGMAGAPRLSELHVHGSPNGELKIVQAGPVDGLANGEVTFGSIQRIGARIMPLVAVHVSRQLSLDVHASWSVRLTTGGVSDQYLGGFTWALPDSRAARNRR